MQSAKYRIALKICTNLYSYSATARRYNPYNFKIKSLSFTARLPLRNNDKEKGRVKTRPRLNSR